MLLETRPLLQYWSVHSKDWTARQLRSSLRSVIHTSAKDGPSAYDGVVSSERRRHHRFPLQRPVSIKAEQGEDPVAGNLLELSVGGAFVSAPIDVPAGQSIYLRFRYQGKHSCQATGHVVRTMPFGKSRGIALTFGVANASLQALLRTLVQMPQSLRPAVLTAIDEVKLSFK